MVEEPPAGAPGLIIEVQLPPRSLLPGPGGIKSPFPLDRNHLLPLEHLAGSCGLGEGAVKDLVDDHLPVEVKGVGSSKCPGGRNTPLRAHPCDPSLQPIVQPDRIRHNATARSIEKEAVRGEQVEPELALLEDSVFPGIEHKLPENILSGFSAVAGKDKAIERLPGPGVIDLDSAWGTSPDLRFMNTDRQPLNNLGARFGEIILSCGKARIMSGDLRLAQGSFPEGDLVHLAGKRLPAAAHVPDIRCGDSP